MVDELKVGSLDDFIFDYIKLENNTINLLCRCSIKEFLEYVENKIDEKFTLCLDKKYNMIIRIENIEIDDDINIKNMKWIKLKYLPVIRI